LWNTEEYLDLIEWMRSYNERHARKLHLVGNDVTYSGPELFDEVIESLRRTHPAEAAEVEALYADLRPVDGVTVWLLSQPARPLQDRQVEADRARRAFEVVDGLPVDALLVQHARVIMQTYRLWSADFDGPSQGAEGWRYREQAMTDNLLWWQERTGHKIVLSAHDGHVALASFWSMYQEVEGTLLRRYLGRRYVSVGFTFAQGSFNAFDPSGDLWPVTVGPPEPGTNEHTLDQVRYDDFALDLRTLPAAAKDWLNTERPTRLYNESYPASDTQIALGRSFDILIHLRDIEASRLLTG
jgi:erythromycin esterase